MVSDLGVKGRALESPNAHLTPAGDGKVFDETLFDLVTRRELSVMSGEQFDEEVAIFAGEYDGAGEEPVTDTISGRDLTAAGGDRSTRFGAVETGGAGSSFGGHPSYMVDEAVGAARGRGV